MPIGRGLAAGAAAALWFGCCCYLQHAAAGASDGSSTAASPTVVGGDTSSTKNSQVNVLDTTTTVNSSSSTEKINAVIANGTTHYSTTAAAAAAASAALQSSSSTLAAAQNASSPSVTAGPGQAKSENVPTTGAVADNGAVSLGTTTAPSAQDSTQFTTQTITTEWLLTNWTLYSSTDFITGWDDSLNTGPSIDGGMIASAVVGSLAGTALVTAGMYVAVRKLRRRLSYESFGGVSGLSNPSYEKFS